jgi:hypothetical protein
MCFVAPIYWHSNYSGRSGFPVVPAFRSFLLYRRSSIPVVLAYRSFQLFSGCCSHGKQYKFYKGKRTKLYVMFYLLSKKSPINFVLLSRNGNKLCNGNNKFKIKITLHLHGPRLIPNHCHLPYPPYFSLLSTCCCILQV